MGSTISGTFQVGQSSSSGTTSTSTTQPTSTTTTTTSNTTICAQLQAQYNTLQTQIDAISSQILTRENADIADGIDPATDPTIQSLSSQYFSLASQANAISADMTNYQCP